MVNEHNKTGEYPMLDKAERRATDLPVESRVGEVPSPQSRGPEGQAHSTEYSAETGSGSRQLDSEKLALLGLISAPIWIWDFESGTVCWGNDSAIDLWDANDLYGLRQRANLASDATQDWLNRLLGSRMGCQSTNGLWVSNSTDNPGTVLCRISPATLDSGRPAAIVEALASDSAPCETEPRRPEASSSVSQARLEADNKNAESRASQLARRQLEILAVMGQDFDLAQILRQISAAVEDCVPETQCTVLLFGPKANQQFNASAQELEPELQDRLWRLCSISDGDEHNPGENGADAVVLDDLEDQDHSPTLRDTAANAGLVSCWVKPILSSTREPLGVLALYQTKRREVAAAEQQIVEAMASLAKLAVETDKRKAALKSANARFASLAATVPGVVYQRKVTPEGDIRYTYISEGARELFGVSPEEIVADPQALFDRHGSEYYATFRDRLLKASKSLTMWDVEATIIARDGKRKFTHAIARPHRQADGSVLWDGIILDATRIKETELAAAATEVRTRNTIIESIPQGFIFFDSDGKLVTHNSHYLDLYPELKTVITPKLGYEAIVRREIELGLNGNPDELDIDEQIASRFEQHNSPNHMIERQLADGRWILVIEKRTDDGGTVILHTDVTELKQREKELQRSNADLQHFASIASHDLQEPLRKIEAFGSRLSKNYGDKLDETGEVYLDRMQNAAVRMRTLINDLLAYSRVTTRGNAFVSVNIDQIANEVVGDLQALLEESGGRVELSDLPEIQADPLQMRMLLQNLIANALKFKREDTAPIVKVTAKLLEPEVGSTVPNCQIIVSDNGIGFEEEYAERIFGVFQRLHGRDEYEGTGIGLATCRKISERHDGSIKAESIPGEGAMFTVTLPTKHITPETSS